MIGIYVADWVLIVALIGVFSGCATSPQETKNPRATWVLPPTNDLPIKAGMPPEQASRARALYALKCTKCHRFYDPAEYTDAEWQRWMRKMSKKSHLQPEQESLISE